MALANGKVRETFAGRWFYLNIRYVRSGWRSVPHFANEGIHALVVALEIDFDSLVAVEHPAGERVRISQAVYERAEANALDNAAHTNETGVCHGYSGPRMQPRPCQ